MKLKKLEILGFKSFRDKTPIDLSRDINAIVGPNGCGKSNIVDAIRWVMGEQRVSMLRGKKMEDVIFNGSDGAPAVGMAEVSITLESNGHKVPEKYASYREITVSRKVFREGDSEYCINKVPCRLVDVKEFFMDVGVGARTYSVVEQERISGLVEAKPEERRQFIEEAAGIMKYKTRRESASRKMEATKQNIVRLNDILREVRTQLNSTSRQAKKAETYRELRKEIREGQLILSLQAYSDLLSNIKQFDNLIIPLNEKVVSAQTELKGLESSIEEIKARLVEGEDAIGSLQDRYYQLKNDINIGEHKIKFAKETILHFDDKKKGDLEEVDALKARWISSEEELAFLKAQNEESDAIISDILEAIEVDREAADVMRATALDLDEELEAEKSKHIDSVTENARLLNLLVSLKKNLEELGKKAQIEENELDENKRKLTSVDEQLSEVRNALSSYINTIEILRQKEISAGEDLVAAKDSLRSLQSDIEKIRGDIGVKRSRLLSLKELEEGNEWCDEGTRAVLEASQRGVLKEEIRGLLVHYIRVPEQYDAAVEAALADVLQCIIVESHGNGLRAIDYLKGKALGRGSFLPLDTFNKADHGNEDCPDGTCRLCDLVQVTDESLRGVLNQLLYNVLLVPDLPAAFRIADLSCNPMTYVTIQGEVLGCNGVITGGVKKGRASSLANIRKISELEEQLKVLNHLLEEENARKLSSENSVIYIEEMAAQVRSEKHSLELVINGIKKDIERLEGEKKWIAQRISVLTFNRDNFESENVLTSERIKSVEGDINSRKEDAKEEEIRIISLQEKWKEVRREMEESERTLTEKKIILTSEEEKRKSGLQTISRLESTIAEIALRSESISKEILSCESKTAEAMNSIRAEEENLHVLYAKHTKAEEELTVKRAEQERENIVNKQKEQELRNARKLSDDLSRQLNGLEMERRETIIQSHTLKGGAREKLDVDLDESLYDFNPMEESRVQELKKKLDKDKQMLDDFGEVNLLALTEHEELKERHDFLAGQVKDLNSSLETLQKTITRINQISRKRFSDTFDAVNGHFREVFPKLFPGGKGFLRLTDESDMLETGVEIDIQIPGKKRQNLTLLSGGEKALAAVALIFSILLHRPSPFLILDEADAPLDDANVSLFRKLITDISLNSQVIFVTHNKTTMEAAENLIGVTMQKNGISTTVSVNMN